VAATLIGGEVIMGALRGADTLVVQSPERIR
jgi:hypothetical protein